MPPAGYSRTQILLHWAVFVLVVLQFVLHDGIAGAFRSLTEGGTPPFDLLVAQHIIGGWLIFAFMVWRLVLRFRRGVPPPPEGEGQVQKVAAAVTHATLYLLLLGIPLTGSIAWFTLSRGAADVHEAGKNVLFILVAVHIAAALFQHYVRGNGLIARMMKAAA